MPGEAQVLGSSNVRLLAHILVDKEDETDGFSISLFV